MKNNNSEDFLKERLALRDTESNLRVLTHSQGLFDFCSNDYLGFARIGSEARKERRGATGSRLISGNSEYAEQLEQKIAQHHQVPAALIFNSGYDANLGLCSAIPVRGDYVFFDELSHASIRDGLRLSFAKSIKFQHNNIESLNFQLEKFPGRKFVITEAVFSMDGDCAPLLDILNLCEKYQAYLIVDEAHSIGVIGDNGEGLVEKLKLQDRLFARVVTYGKAFGCHGAAVLGSNTLKNYLVNFARSLIYTTALPPESLSKISESYDLILSEQGALQKLQENIRYLDEQLNKLSLPLVASGTAIKSLLISGNDKALAAAKYLQERGFDIKAIRSPTVPKGAERLRICLHSFNEIAEIDALIVSLRELQEQGVFDAV